MIRLEHVHKYFNRRKPGEIHAINDTSLELPESGIVALLGPSGCGKTTLLNAIGGLDMVQSGQIIIDGQRITGMRSGKVDTLRNAKIGYIFQNYHLLDQRTVFENVAIALRMIGIRDKETIRERVHYCLRAVGLYPFRSKRADALSGGQRQRVAIARAIVKNPRIIIADEPTGNLDSANTLEIMNLIKTVSEDRLVVLVTHERKLAEFYASRIIEIKDGCVAEDRSNEPGQSLDYQLENKIYLWDLPAHESYGTERVRLEYYEDRAQAGRIRLVLRGNNLYIDTGGRYQVIDEDSGIQLLDEHYTAMDERIYADHRFRYDAYLPEAHQARYTSIYTPWTTLRSGFQTVRSFRRLKKFLLIGFGFAAVFSFLAISNILGVLDIEEKDYLTTNANYVTVANTGKDPDMLTQAAAADGASYALPGNTQISVSMLLNKYLQSAQTTLDFGASLTRLSTIGEDDLRYGRMPENSQEIVLDSMAAEKILDADLVQQVGIDRIKAFLGQEIRIGSLEPYTIVGIAETNSPSIFFTDDICMTVLTNAGDGETMQEATFYSAMDDLDMTSGEDDDAGGVSVQDYALRPDTLSIKKGHAPESDYEVVVSEQHSEEMALGKTISVKQAGQNLKVVGYYATDTPADDVYYVNAHTVELQYISKQKNLSVYGDDPEALQQALDEAGYSAKVNKDRDRESYQKEMKSLTHSSLVVAGIMVLIAFIEMYLMLRSSFLSRIKEVGTMRAIGLKKRDVYRMFSGEIFAMTLMTAIPGLILIYYIWGSIIKVSSYLEGMYVVTPAVAGLTLAVILIFNLIAGLLPVFRTMRRTPAEILARTDI